MESSLLIGCRVVVVVEDVLDVFVEEVLDVGVNSAQLGPLEESFRLFSFAAPFERELGHLSPSDGEFK
ncbi:MAG: hypothetical protein ACYC06_09820 [Ilumatobacteraceae bacterium]